MQSYASCNIIQINKMQGREVSTSTSCDSEIGAPKRKKTGARWEGTKESFYDLQIL